MDNARLKMISIEIETLGNLIFDKKWKDIEERYGTMTVKLRGSELYRMAKNNEPTDNEPI